MRGGRLLRGVALVACSFAICAAGGPMRAGASAPEDDLLGCARRVFDPSGLTGPELESAADAAAARLHADLHVRVEGSLDGDIDGRERMLEQSCPGWTDTAAGGGAGLRADDLLVVMVSPSERQTSIYYGDDFYARLNATDAQIQQFVMNPRFADGDVEQGLLDGLDAIEVAVGGGGVPQAHAPLYGEDDFNGSSSSSSTSGSSGSDGSGLPVVGIIGLIVLVLIVSLGSKWAQDNGWISTDSSSGYRRSWSSRSSSSSRSFSSSSSHRSSSSSRHSGGGGHSSRW